MLISHLKVNNFRCFHGTQEMSFSTDPKKNVTLIHGENGSGKSTILNAILWCFYGTTSQSFKDPKVLINKAAETENKRDYSVEVAFEEGDKAYLVQRQIIDLREEKFRILVIGEDGNSNIVKQPLFFLNSIIPKEMAEYFFFSGESQVKALGTQSLRAAVRDVLGFKVAERGIESINKVRTSLRKAYSQANVKSEFAERQKRLSYLEVICENETNKLQKLVEEEKFLSERKRGIEKELEESDHQIVRQKQKLREQKEKEIEQNKTRLRRSKSQRAGLITNYAISSFSNKAASKGISFIDESQLKGRIPAPYNTQLVKDILEQTKCICGAKIAPGSTGYSEIQKLLATAADPNLINRVSRARSQLN